MLLLVYFACEQNMLANSALTPLPQSSKLSCPSDHFDLVIESVSNILLYVFFLTIRYHML